MSNHIVLDPIEDAIKAIKNGEVIIVVDDENRENEGDFLCAASMISDKVVNFMIKEGRGLLCTPLTESRCEELQLDMMTPKNTDPKQTAFTISVDLLGNGVTTGISSSDRAKTIKALTDSKALASDFSRPGHIFPLKARNGGVLRRAGHTEAAVDFARLAGLPPAGVIVEIMNDDGSMARLPELKEIASKFNLKLVSIEDLIKYRLQKESLIQKKESFPIKTYFGEFQLTAFQQDDNDQLHFALSLGDWNHNDVVPVRVKSNHYYNLFSTLTDGENNDFELATSILKKEKKGVLILINNVNSSDTILGKLDQYKQFQEGNSELPVTPMDNKDYGIGAQIIHQLGIQKVKLISNTKKKLKAIEGYDIHIVDYIPLS